VSDDPTTRHLTLVVDDEVTLEAEARLVDAEQVPGPDAIHGAVVLAHPHPLAGGDMRSLVIAELFRLLPPMGLSVLRFDFRGVGRSTGAHDHGRGEAADLSAALDALASLAPGRPLLLCGWSFGADVALSITDPRIDGWVGIAPPLRVLPIEELAAAAGSDPRPTLLLVPEHDQHLPPDAAREAVGSWLATRVEVVPGADHFLAGRTVLVSRLVADFAASLA
jgi:alpha/beta superfamily hydrolase